MVQSHLVEWVRLADLHHASDLLLPKKVDAPRH